MSVATRETAARPRRRSLPAGAGWIAFGALALVAFAGLLYLGRSTTFYFDEWDWVQGRRAWNAAALLEPHNEHLSLVPVLVFKLLFSTVGTDSYVPFRVAGLLLHCGVAALLFAYTRKRVGELLALGAAAVVLFLGTAWPDVLWPFQIGFLSSLAAGIGALLALDREDRRGDVIAAVLLGVALASSSLGLPLLAALRARGARAARPALALVDRRRAGRALRGLVRRLRRRGRRRPRTTCSARPATSPTRPRAPRARCSRSTWTGAARSPWWASSRCW